VAACYIVVLYISLLVAKCFHWSSREMFLLLTKGRRRSFFDLCDLPELSFVHPRLDIAVEGTMKQRLGVAGSVIAWILCF
jgi:hypothetical protein